MSAVRSLRWWLASVPCVIHGRDWKKKEKENKQTSSTCCSQDSTWSHTLNFSLSWTWSTGSGSLKFFLPTSGVNWMSLLSTHSTAGRQGKSSLPAQSPHQVKLPMGQWFCQENITCQEYMAWSNTESWLFYICFRAVIKLLPWAKQGPKTRGKKTPFES